MLLGTSATEYATVPLVLNFTDVHEHKDENLPTPFITLETLVSKKYYLHIILHFLSKVGE